MKTITLIFLLFLLPLISLGQVEKLKATKYRVKIANGSWGSWKSIKDNGYDFNIVIDMTSSTVKLFLDKNESFLILENMGYEKRENQDEVISFYCKDINRNDTYIMWIRNKTNNPPYERLDFITPTSTKSYDIE